EMTSSLRHAHRLASHDFFCFDGMTIDLFACLIVGAKRGSLERQASKHPPGTRVAEDLSAHPSVGIRGSITPFGSSSNGSISSQLNLAAENGFHASVIHHQQDQVGSFSADLKADTAAFQRIHRGSSPRAIKFLALAAN